MQRGRCDCILRKPVLKDWKCTISKKKDLLLDVVWKYIISSIRASLGTFNVDQIKGQSTEYSIVEARKCFWGGPWVSRFHVLVYGICHREKELFKYFVLWMCA